MIVLGIWDGHDAGAAIIDTVEGSVRCAINEERLTRRKLEVSFPSKSIRACLDFAELAPSSIDEVAGSTSDFAKSLTRVFPFLKERYYLQRRRMVPPGWATSLSRQFKYRATTFRPGPASRFVSRRAMMRRLGRLGLSEKPFFLLDHHLAHASCAARTSGLARALVVTLDGVGDGLSGSFSAFEDGKLRPIATIGARDSLGIFFEHVTQLMNMRELEDEGKVMALAGYGYPPSHGENPLCDLYSLDGLRLRCRLSPTGLRRSLARTLSMMPTEQFAWFAQDLLEHYVCRLVGNAVSQTGLDQVVYAGGIASNIRVNLRLRELDGVARLSVFPHMGDGGLALGAALIRAGVHDPAKQFPLNDLRLGPAAGEATIARTVRDSGLSFRRPQALEKEVAAIIARGEVVMWYQGRMEFGPRALGGRSILARPDRVEIRDRLNLSLKRRVWYQPFCPSILDSDADDLVLGLGDRLNPHMTMAYRVPEASRPRLAGVLGPDGTCRPQIVSESDGRYHRLLQEVKEAIGVGALLNTSFNLHGEPMVATPEDAIRTFQKSGADWLVIDDWITDGACGA